MSSPRYCSAQPGGSSHNRHRCCLVTKSAISGQTDIVRNVIAAGRAPERLLEIGIGNGVAARAFLAAGCTVVATGFDVDEYLSEPLPDELEFHSDIDMTDLSIFDSDSFDAVWCAHVLEHVLDTGCALAEVRRVLRPDGRLMVSVPPFKHQVVGGHVHPGWNVGILMYVLAVCGFDLRDGAFVHHGYNIFADVRNGRGFRGQRPLRFANGDIEKLRRMRRFPRGFPARQGFDGDIAGWNWHWRVQPECEPRTAGEEAASSA